MSKAGNIEVVARVRPCFAPGEDYELMQPDELNENGIRIEVKPGTRLGWITNPKEMYNFGFSKLFWKNSTQESIFNNVAKPLIDHAIEGYNATLFAYGQTGSGKTYTLSGGDTYDERGIIPRGIAYAFQQLKKNNEYAFDVRVSYVELFNTNAYDLLSNEQDARERRLENLTKVIINDTEEGVELRHDTAGFSSPLVPCEDFETALAQLFLGETNRAIAETSSNAVSSRSHCIFTLHLLGRNAQTGSLRQSKIHFVDLAGSERMENLGGERDRMVEARFINLTLFYLHGVIEALKNKSEFIPYRSSKLTMILKDSLGGNCMTTMIAALSSRFAHIHETIETCKFAENVMTIKNSAKANVSLDPQVLIAKLRQEIIKLRHELAVARGEEEDTPMTDEERQELEENLSQYMSGKGELPTISPSRLGFCFEYIRMHAPQTQETKTEIVMSDSEMKKALNKLGKKLQRRENEISVLVNMLNQKKNRSLAWTQTNIDDGSQTEVIHEQPLDKKEAFTKFYSNHPKARAIASNTSSLKEKVSSAKELTAKAKQMKDEITKLKNGLADEEDLDQLKAEIVEKTNTYLKVCDSIKSIKREVETIQVMIESAKKQIKKDFAAFWTGQSQNSGNSVPVAVTIEPKEQESTGDPQADEVIRRFKETREAFLRKAAETRKSRQN